jgi:hypothetical protein
VRFDIGHPNDAKVIYANTGRNMRELHELSPIVLQ